MQVTNGDVFLAAEPLQRLLAQRDIPVRQSVLIVRMARKLNEEIITVKQERDKLIVKYGEKTEDGGYHIGPGMPGQPDFVREQMELMSGTVELALDGKVKIPNTINMSGEDLMLLDLFVEVEEN